MLVAIAAFFLVSPDDPFALKNLQIAVLATAMGLGVMGIWHFFRSPWLLQKNGGKVKPEDDSSGWGILGLLIFMGIIGGAIYGSMRAYHAKIPDLQVTFPAILVPTLPSEKILVARQPLQESPNSLRRRTLRLLDDLTVFWAHRPDAPPQPVQNPGTEEDRQRNAKWNEYWKDVDAAYNSANYRGKLLGIVREYKAKGLSTGWLEDGIAQPTRLVGDYMRWGGAEEDCLRSTSEICLLRELAYHVDAQDKPIFLSAK